MPDVADLYDDWQARQSDETPDDDNDAEIPF